LPILEQIKNCQKFVFCRADQKWAKIGKIGKNWPILEQIKNWQNWQKLAYSRADQKLPKKLPILEKIKIENVFALPQGVRLKEPSHSHAPYILESGYYVQFWVSQTASTPEHGLPRGSRGKFSTSSKATGLKFGNLARAQTADLSDFEFY